MEPRTDSDRIERIVIMQELYIEFLEKHLRWDGTDTLDESTPSDAIANKISQSKIKLEKDKERLRHAKQIEKQNDKFRKDRKQAERERARKADKL